MDDSTPEQRAFNATWRGVGTKNAAPFIISRYSALWCAGNGRKGGEKRKGGRKKLDWIDKQASYLDKDYRHGDDRPF